MKTSGSNHLAPADYRAGLLRLWRQGAGGAWRASMQLAEGGERLSFADLEHLFAYLRRLTEEPHSQPVSGWDGREE